MPHPLNDHRHPNYTYRHSNYTYRHPNAALVFEEVKATLDLFTYSAQYQIIHPPHQVKQVVTIKEIAHKDIHNAVLLKDIKNLGAEVIYMYDLDQPIIEANKITFNPGDIKQNTYSPNLRFNNLSTRNKGKMEVWREVHQ